MFFRALLAFFILPGVIAFGIPTVWLLATTPGNLTNPFGLLSLFLGMIGLLWCVRDFYVQGKGTLAPWAPPTHLVIIGLYRWSRNPMYISVLLILMGWAWAFSHLGLFIYTMVVAIAFHLRVILGEEPWLARTYGADWQEYVGRVRRWL